MKKALVCTQCGLAGKYPPGALTDDEMHSLLGAFIEGKTRILEDDALTLVQWAQRMRMGNVVLQMILDGDLTPVVEGAEVFVAQRPAAAPERR